jgi:hypothetical protein
MVSLCRASVALLSLASLPVAACSGSSTPAASSGDDGGDCYPDNDGINNVPSPVYLVVTDTGFYAGSPDAGPDLDAGMKTVITTQNSSTVTLTLTNAGTTEHGFEVECTSVLPSYPNLPAGCASTACFPSGSTIGPIAPGTSTTVTFVTPAPDNLLFPFKSNAAGDANNAALNGSDGAGWELL